MLDKQSGPDYFGGEPDAERWAEAKQRRLDWIEPEGRAFEERVRQRFSAEDVEQIIKALDWMIALHASQEDRKEGKPYLDHTLAVATTVEQDYGITDPDIVVAASLHDVLEDQALHLAWDHLLAKHPEIGSMTEEEIWQHYGSPDHNEIMPLALHRLEQGFSKRVANMAGQLRNPDYNVLVANYQKAGKPAPMTENQFYAQHVREMAQDPEIFVVKMADLSANVSSLSNLPEGDSKRQKARRKYGPVIRDIILPKLRDLKEGHPLYTKQEELIARFQAVYDQEYKGRC